MAGKTRPPRDAEWLLKRLTSTRDLFNCVGDFHEEYARRLQNEGTLRARLWYRRHKEVGIRKTLGAGVWNIVVLLSRAFTKWVLLAGLLAAPLACLAMNGWLNRFAYRIAIDWKAPLLAVALALGAALLTVGHQALQAGLADPVKALREE